MAVTQFKDVSWGTDEPIDTNKLNAMVTNNRFVFERSATLRYAAYSTTTDLHMRILNGVEPISPTSGPVETINVSFGSVFVPGCRPIIVTSLTSPYNRGVIETINGLAGVSSLPDYRGFACTIVTRELADDQQKIFKPMKLNWIAMGFAKDNSDY